MRIFILIAVLLASPALSQDRDGNDTPGEWVITHHKPFGLWDSMCDERKTGDVLEQRCYLRYVDVFSPRPNFGAIFAFVTADGSVEFGFEIGTVFKPDGLRIEKDGTAKWTMPHRPCLFGGTCRFSDNEATELLAAMSASDALTFDFIDRHGTAQLRNWDLTEFANALSDFHAGIKQRGL